MITGKLAYVKRVVSKGHVYEYFDTGRVNERGKKIFTALPARTDIRFGGVYATLLGHRTRQAEIEQAQQEIRLSKAIALYEQSPRYQKLARKSQSLYSSYLGRFCTALGDPPVAEVEKRDLMTVLDTMADRPAAANLLFRIVSAFYLWARKRFEIDTDPAREIDQHELGEHQPWPEDLLTEALAADDERIRLAVSLLYYTAQRIGDVCKMTWGDVRDGYLYVKQEKTGKELDIRLHSKLAALLDTLPRYQTDSIQAAKAEYILGGERGGYHRTTVRKWLQTFASDRGHEIVPHGLRKNAINALLEAECSAAQVSAISGQSLQMVEHYAKLRNNRRIGSAAVLKWERNG